MVELCTEKFSDILIIMKKYNYIDYSIRAKFDEFISEDTSFIQTLIRDHNIQSVLEVPCGNGRNLSVIAGAVSKAYFADINSNMVETVQHRILSEGRSNCCALVLDMSDMSNVNFEVDAIFIMQQSFQMLSFEMAKRALLNFKKVNSRLIIIDVYDFIKGSHDLPAFLLSPRSFSDIDNTTWVRKSRVLSVDGALVKIGHEYKSDSNHLYSEVHLQNYSRNDFLNLCEMCGYSTYDFYTDYTFGKDLSKGRTIIIIKS